MPAATETDFPLFPLGLVALPGERIPLHIFEQRYLVMIGECLEREREFGIVWLSDSELKPTGCACTVGDVLERLEDGRMNILTIATRPFRLLERQGDLPYPAGHIEFLDDTSEETDAALLEEVRECYASLHERATDTPPEPYELGRMDAYAIAARVDFGLEAKQQLLELRSENSRLALLAKLLRAASKRLDLVDRAQARARSNGKVRF